MAINVAVSVVQTGSDNNHGNKVTCMTPQCRLTAAGILADPSQHFSKFAFTPLFTASLGGGFYAKHEIPSCGTSVGLLETVYCMNETAILKAGRKPLANEIQKITTSLPAFGSPPDKTVLMKTLGHLNRLGLRIPNIYNPTLRSDLADPLVNILSNYCPQHIA
ncbi:hypothetical protein K457DRAFT_128879 [Linnemannia elongata AG-77]|uniref:Uncharacterized protein n=1 Tax=Linnemannia elongata AG-77 TaxID=1314771 RepID=A0A197JN22_9FUNG|nr:hypothetical protein K457DRAFT_128879 [Linnemannia elongata AG-77]